VVVRDRHTEKPYYERVDAVKLEDHVIIAKHMKLGDGPLADEETSAIEAVIGMALDSSWVSDRPPWRVIVHPMATSDGSTTNRCFIAFSFSHTISDGLGGPIFHGSFLDAIHLFDASKEALAEVKPTHSLPDPFDTPQRLPSRCVSPVS
jgi:hypothetical protein